MSNHEDLPARPVPVSRREIMLASLGVAAVTATAANRVAAQASSSGSMMAQATGPAVAVLLDQGATVIDFAGAWDVFAAAEFRPFIVAPTKDLVMTISGMRITPDYDFDDAPMPDVILVPAQGGGGNVAKLAWLRKAHEKSRATLSVCTGSFILARAGLLEGLPATTHHDAYDLFAKTFPRVKVVRGQPFVLSGKIGTASAGLFGVDLALNTVARLSNVKNAEDAAAYMGHSDGGWRRSA